MSLEFTLNGEPVRIDELDPTTTLLDWLRETRRLTGTKEGCAEGDCGACTVVAVDPRGPTVRAIDACIALVPMMHGQDVWTVEGLGRATAPHPVQAAISAHLASQCGYCTSGIAMSLAELAHRRHTTPGQVDDQLCGNLCRCTGYRPIRDAATALAGSCPEDGLARALARASRPLTGGTLAHAGRTWHAPVTWDEALDALARPGARVVAGGTDLGLEITMRRLRPTALVSVERLSGMADLATNERAVLIGAAAPLTDVEAYVASRAPMLARMLRYFGSRQIKHRATMGGNLATASPIGDLAPVLLALDATVFVRGRAGERAIPIDAFFTAYRKTALAPGELIVRIEIPHADPATRQGAYKVARRREMDISAVAGAFAVTVAFGSVVRARLAFGGMAATPKRATALEAALVGRPWTRASVTSAVDALTADFSPIDDHRASAWYRATVARNLVIGFFAETEHVPVRALGDRPLSTFVRDAT